MPSFNSYFDITGGQISDLTFRTMAVVPHFGHCEVAAKWSNMCCISLKLLRKRLQDNRNDENNKYKCVFIQYGNTVSSTFTIYKHILIHIYMHYVLYICICIYIYISSFIVCILYYPPVNEHGNGKYIVVCGFCDCSLHF